MKQREERNPDRAMQDLAEDIRRERVPERLAELARALQTALDARSGG
ncbi:hypothetical protein JQ506_10580 [Shinella sp. PSBB067]|nr:hypothetical protein [Shinella sp. PSBB067]QRI65382.1 hypothetical protein JQ506_10580 [Shinella sp. PSBB067]